VSQETLRATLVLSDGPRDCELIIWYEDEGDPRFHEYEIHGVNLKLDAEWFTDFARDLVAEYSIAVGLNGGYTPVLSIALDSMRIHGGELEIMNHAIESEAAEWLTRREKAAA